MVDLRPPSARHKYMRSNVPVQRRRADLRALALLSLTVRCNRLLGDWHNIAYEYVFRAIHFVNVGADADKP